MTDNRGAVVITGSSSGLGRHTALRLARQGFTVYAGVRSDAAADDLRREAEQDTAIGGRLRPVLLDVTSVESIAAAHKLIAEETTSLTGLINNAGVCVSGPIECLTSDALRTELEVHVIGAAAVIRQFLPLLRAPGPGGARGRIVNIGSGTGRVAAPYLGAYAASQFAKEGLTDSLRRELAPLAVGVSLVEPGAIATPIWGKLAEASAKVIDAAPTEVASLYRDRFTAFVALNDKRGRGSRTQPTQVSDAILHALTARRPKTRYRVGLDSALTSLTARILPDRLLDFVIARSLSSLTK